MAPINISDLCDCNGIRAHNNLVCKRTLNHLAKQAKWWNCVVSTYLCGAFDCLAKMTYYMLELIFFIHMFRSMSMYLTKFARICGHFICFKVVYSLFCFLPQMFWLIPKYYLLQQKLSFCQINFVTWRCSSRRISYLWIF